jgi:TonB-linked SusC/RagA family outer membrane protein
MLCVLSCTLALHAQKRVSGTVVDVDGEAIIGANIVEKGTANGSISDVNGAFSLTVRDNAVLQISFIGYVAREIATGNLTTFQITLQEDLQALDEVIVVGYGTMKKSDLTGAVGRVIMEGTSKIPNTDLAQALSGASAGVSITQNANAEGEASISIRGKTSLSANDNPLIVLDGIIYNGSIVNINVNDIEYIDILKDASAAAVYGSRSANGVVLITTKKGREGKHRISLNAYCGVQAPSNIKMKVMNAEQYALRLTDYYYQQSLYSWYRDGQPTGDAGKPVYPDIANREVVARSLRTQEERDMYLKGGHDIDWVDAALADNPVIHSYDASFSGQNERVNYYASVSYTGEERIRVNDVFDRYTFNTKIDGKLTSWLSAGMNVNYSYRDYSGIAANLEDARKISPLANVTDPTKPESVYLTGETYMPHPMRGLLVSDVDIRNELFFVGNVKIEVPFVKGLSYDFNYSNTYYNRKRNTFYPVATSDGVATNGRAQRRPEETRSWIYNNIVSYQNKFGEHSIQATLLYSREKYSGESYVFTSEFFENPTLEYNKMDMGTKLSTSDNKAWQETGVSYMGRVNYQFRNRYMAGATVRRDGFSGFGANSKFVTLPSVSLGWIASEEAFMESLPWLYLKLRLSYGQNGNQGIGRYSSLAQMATQSYVYGSSSVVGVYPNTMANSSLAWEKTDSYNAGFDFGLMERRISGSLELYTAQTGDVLVKRKIPWSSGYEEIWTNIGGISNRGFELSVNSHNIDLPNFKWDTGVTFTLNRDKITKLYGGDNDIDIGNSWFTGEPILSVYDYKMTGGLWTEEEFYSGNILSGWYPGQYKYWDKDGNGSITPDDRTIIGNKAPNYSFSISNTLTCKNWSLYFFLNSIQGGNGYYLWNNYDYVNVSSRSDDVYRINQQATRQYWTPANGVNDATGIYNSPAQTSGIYQDRSFVRLQDISLSYNFGPKTLKALGGMEYLQVYISGKNLYNWTGFSFWDPEYVSNDTDDRPHLPSTRNVVCGVKLSF